MEKQIVIKHSYSDIAFKIKNIVSYLKLFIDSNNDKFIFNFSIKKNQSKIVDELKNLNQLNSIYILNEKTSKNLYNIDIACDLDDVISILDIIEKYQLCVMISCNDIKMNVNDNDGDFIIMNTKHKKYQTIKKQSK